MTPSQSRVSDSRTTNSGFRSRHKNRCETVIRGTPDGHLAAALTSANRPELVAERKPFTRYAGTVDVGLDWFCQGVAPRRTSEWCAGPIGARYLCGDIGHRTRRSRLR